MTKKTKKYFSLYKLKKMSNITFDMKCTSGGYGLDYPVNGCLQTLLSSGGGGSSSVCANPPLQVSASCVEMTPAAFCGAVHQYIPAPAGVGWGIYRSPGITEVTVGVPGSGATFTSVQDALNCSPFVRVLSTLSELAPLTVPVNSIIYVDPGIALTLPGPIDITSKSLTILGNASLNSSTVVFTGQLLCNANTRLYFNNVRIQNRAGRSLITTTTSNYGQIEALETTFVTADNDNSLFGEGNGTEIIVLLMKDCIVESGGTNSQRFIGRMRDNAAVIHIQGLAILLARFAPLAVLAETAINECLLSDINILAQGSDTANPYSWNTSGVVTNFKQATNATFVVLNFDGTTVNANNLYIHAFTVRSSFTTINNVITTTTANISIDAQDAILSNLSLQGTLTSNADGQQFTNCQVERLIVNSSQTMMENVRCSASVTVNNGSNNIFSNINSPPGISLINSSNNTFSNCICSGGNGNIDSTSTNNTFTGGEQGKITVDGIRNTFTGIHFTSTFTVSPGANETRCTNCRPQQVSWAGADGVMADLDVMTKIELGVGGISPRCIIANCRVGANGGPGNNIDIVSNDDCVVTNCIVGLRGGAGVSILTPNSGAPMTTLISNCKTVAAIVGGSQVNCTTF